MTRFEETNGVIHDASRTTGVQMPGYYATCAAKGCTWVGPIRATEAAAKRDAVAHHDDDRAY